MSAVEWDLATVVNNDVTLNFFLAYGPVPLDLSTLTPRFMLKASRLAPDSGGLFLAPTVTDAILGELSVTIYRQYLTNPGQMWYRLDVITALGLVKTTIFGVLTVNSA